MKPYKHILLATDFSENNQAPIAKAKFLTDDLNCKLSLVHIIEPIPAYGYPGFDNLESPLIEHSQKELDKIAEKLDVKPGNQFIKFGSVKNQVLELAQELQVDLIIIGSHGRHGFSRLLGSSANSIINHADCDVLTVRCQ